MPSGIASPTMLHRSFSFLAYCTLLGEATYTKFIFDVTQNCINDLSAVFFQTQFASSTVSGVAATLSGLNLMASLAVISPKKNTDDLLNHTHLSENFNTIKFISVFAMIINFSIGGASSWLGFYNLLSLYPALNYTLGSLLTIIGFSYYILFSAKDVINNTNDFLKLDFLAVKNKLCETKLIFMATLLKFLISAIYRAVTYGFIGALIVEKILQSPKYITTGVAAGISSSFSVSLFTRFPIIFAENNNNLLSNHDIYSHANKLIAVLLNLFGRATSGLLSIYSMHQLLKNTMGDYGAIFFGLIIVFINSAVEFRYRNKKILQRTSELKSAFFSESRRSTTNPDSSKLLNYGGV